MESNCENCKHYKVINGKEYYDDICIDCAANNAPYFKPKTKTNRQWLDSLSDKEYAEKSYYIFTTASIDDLGYHPVYASSLPNPDKKLYPNKEMVVEENMNWLQAEHKGEVRGREKEM